MPPVYKDIEVKKYCNKVTPQYTLLGEELCQEVSIYCHRLLMTGNMTSTETRNLFEKYAQRLSESCKNDLQCDRLEAAKTILKMTVALLTKVGCFEREDDELVSHAITVHQKIFPCAL